MTSQTRDKLATGLAVALAIAGVVWLALLLSQVCVPICEAGATCASDCGFNSPWFPAAALLAIACAGFAAWRLYVRAHK